MQPRHCYFPQAPVPQFETNMHVGVDVPHQLLGSAPQHDRNGAYQGEQ
jgi:hypothetical protein